MKHLFVAEDGTETILDYTKEELVYAKKVQQQDQIVYEQELAEAESKATAKAAILDRLGLTAEEAALLLS